MAGETILIIDDEEPQREAVGGYLRKRGFRVLEGANGRQGLELLKEQAVDLIITDMRMPEMDGMGVLAEARQTRLLDPDSGSTPTPLAGRPEPGPTVHLDRTALEFRFVIPEAGYPVQACFR